MFFVGELVDTGKKNRCCCTPGEGVKMIVVGEFEMILRTSAVLAISGERKPEDREDTGLNGAYNRVFKSGHV